MIINPTREPLWSFFVLFHLEIDVCGRTFVLDIGLVVELQSKNYLPWCNMFVEFTVMYVVNYDMDVCLMV